MQEIWKNLTNGIRQYCRNNGFEDVVLGLSGGLDSAVTAIAAMDALGAEHVHALMMYTKNTSSLSLQIARKIASMNKLNFKEINIQPDVDNMEKSLELIMDAPLKNIVRENLQARIRGLILMAKSTRTAICFWPAATNPKLPWDIVRFTAIPAGDWLQSESFTKARFLSWRNGVTNRARHCRWR